jgi:cytochrome c oxidase subunit 2
MATGGARLMGDLIRRLLFLPPQATKLAVRVDKLHMFVILTTFFISTVIGVMAVFFMGRYRRRKAFQQTPHIESPPWLEALFVIVPMIFFLAWWRIGFAQFVDMTSPPSDAMDVYVMGKKWMWKFAYPDGPNGLSVLRVPARRPVRLLLTSRDVIHSFYVPAFRVKADALPGRYNQLWFEATKPGHYPVFCAEYCGTGHSTMRAEVEVLEPEEFDRWLESESKGRVLQRDTAVVPAPGADYPNEIVAEGRRQAAKQGCLKCHSIDGSPHIGPTWLDLYQRREKFEDGSTLVVDEAYITESMMEPKKKQVAGFPLVMPSFFGKLSQPETAAIVEYIKSLRTGVGDLPQERPVYGPK